VPQISPQTLMNWASDNWPTVAFLIVGTIAGLVDLYLILTEQLTISQRVWEWNLEYRILGAVAMVILASLCSGVWWCVGLIGLVAGHLFWH